MHKQKNETDVPFWIGQSFLLLHVPFLCSCVSMYSLYTKSGDPLYNTEDFVLFCTSVV